MSEVKLLILPSVVKERMALHTNVDDKLIRPEIKAAQDLYIRPLLGSILFDKVLNDACANTLAGSYLTIFNEYLIEATCNYVMAELPDGINYQYWNKGVASKTTQDSENPTMSDLYRIVAKYKKRAEHYANACRLYILQNVQQFPEYHAPGGIDKVPPDNAVYTSPIYLGLRDAKYGEPNRDPNYNSNDPYYIP